MKTDHVKMLFDISELNSLFEGGNIDDFLQKTVGMVADHMMADVCSIYIMDDSRGDLVLRATRGLKQNAVGSVSLKPGEGLVGTALDQMITICEDQGSRDPRFKHYPGIGEELYEAFLAVPMTIGKKKIGVIVVQRGDTCFEETDVLAMRATASQLASMMENIKLVMSINQPKGLEEAESPATPFNTDTFKFIKGKSASRGFALSPSAVYDKGSIAIADSDSIFGNIYSIDEFEQALGSTEKQLEELQNKVEEKLSDAASLIFSYHLLMLKDSGFTGAMRALINEGENPTRAIVSIYNKYRGLFLQSANPLIREKIQDIEDVTMRIMDNLFHREEFHHEYKGRIVIARELYPSELLKLSVDEITGIILVSGGVTSHVSILARSLGIPLIIANEPALLEIPENTFILLDADQGNIYLNPSDEIIMNFTDARKLLATVPDDPALRVPTATADGTRITLMANINLLLDIEKVKDIDIDGVGLYRTEFPFMIRSNFPSEEEQFVIYQKLVQGMGGKPVTFRTLDIGGDKVLSYYDFAREDNPFLGMRSIRFSLRHQDIFKQQIRAILRAGRESPLRIMFPMISSVDEFIASREVVRKAQEELESEGYGHCSNPAIGLMVEIPSAVTIIEDLAMEADFLSIGTNDLIQYTLAVDRTNEKVGDLYIPHHPAILRSLKKISDAGAIHSLDVSVCGDMAGDERYIPFLLGIGLHSLSVDSVYLPRIKKYIASLTMDKAISLSESMLASSTVKEVEKILGSQNAVM